MTTPVAAGEGMHFGEGGVRGGRTVQRGGAGGRSQAGGGVKTWDPEGRDCGRSPAGVAGRGEFSR